MLAFHGHTSAAIADEFHSGELTFAHMGKIDLRRAAKRAFLAIAARVAEVAGVFGNSAALFAGIGHRAPPFSMGGSMDGLPRGGRPRGVDMTIGKILRRLVNRGAAGGQSEADLTIDCCATFRYR